MYLFYFFGDTSFIVLLFNLKQNKGYVRMCVLCLVYILHLLYLLDTTHAVIGQFSGPYSPVRTAKI